MDRTRIIIVWIVMASVITIIAYLLGASWLWSILIGILTVAIVVGGASGYMYWKQMRLVKSAAQFDIDLKTGKIHPANLRRMYFSGGQARKDAIYIASKGMNVSEKEAERRLSEKINKQAINQEMAKSQPKSRRRMR